MGAAIINQPNSGLSKKKTIVSKQPSSVGKEQQQNVKIRNSKGGTKAPITKEVQPAIVQVGMPMDDDKSNNSSYTDRKLNKGRRVLVGGVNIIDQQIKQKETNPPPILASHNKQPSVVNYVDML